MPSEQILDASRDEAPSTTPGDALLVAPPDQAAPTGGGLTNVLLLVGTVAIASGTPTAARLAMRELPAVSAGLVRFSISASLLLITFAIVRLRARTPLTPIARRDYGRFLLAAALCVPINQPCFLLGTQLASATHAALMYGLTPVLVYLLALVLRRSIWSRRMGFATLVAFAGAASLVWDRLQFEMSHSFMIGLLLLFGAVFSWAGYSIVSAPLAQKYGPLRALTIVMVAGVILYTPAWLIDGSRFDLRTISTGALAGFGYITLVTSYANYLIWYATLSRVEINRASIAKNASPLFAVIVAWLILREPMTPWLAIAAVLIVGAIALANWDKLRRRPRPAP